MKFFISLFFIINVSLAYSQQLYKAKIVDGITHQALQGANVKLEDSHQGGASDENGDIEINLTTLPVIIRISHIGYADEIRSIKIVPNYYDVIYLYPINEILSEITISDVNEIQSLSVVEKYSVTDFEIVKNRIFQLEYYNAFEKFQLKITDLEGISIQTIPLREISRVHDLFLSCNEVVYIRSKNYVYPVSGFIDQFSLGEKKKIDDFTESVTACKYKIDSKLYFLREHHNGLMKEITSFDLSVKEHALVKVVSQNDRIRSLHENDRLIAVGQGTVDSELMTVSEKLNLRKIQQESDFLIYHFYKHEYPVCFGQLNGKLVLYNHVERKIEIYEKDKLSSEIEINYVLDNKWLKKMIQDKMTGKSYVLFKLNSGIGIKEVNPLTGKVQLKGIVQTMVQDYDKIEILADTVYFLRSDDQTGSKMELCKLIL